MEEKLYTIPVMDAFKVDCECPLCKMRDDIEIVSIDVDKTRDLAMKYDIEFVPMVLTFKNGEYLQRFGGFHKKEEMSEMISNVLYKKKDRPKFE